MMRNISPRAHAPTGLPGRDVSAVRNMTGIYLGTDESKAYPKARHIIPPLARCRALNKRSRTPTEERRYQKDFAQGGRDRPGHNQKLVELLRYKEERRGFSGNPVKRRTPGGTSETPPPALPPQLRAEDVEIWDITKQTQRHFTAATNSGVTHLEFLNPDVDVSVTSGDRDAFTAPLAGASVVQEVHRAASGRQSATGLTEAYKNVCKGNIEALQHLLPARTLRPPATAPGSTNYRYTGFTVKSYRNPNQAEIAATFDPPADRPRTVGRTNTPGSRPFVPSPFFYKNTNNNSTTHKHHPAGAGSPRQGYNDSPLNTLHGAGVLSQSGGRGRSRAVQEVLHGNTYSAKVPPTVPRSTPAPKSAKSGTTSLGGSDNEAAELASAEDPRVDINVPGTSSGVPEPEPSVGAMSGMEIVIGLEDEQGEQRPVEIDEADEQLSSTPQVDQEEDRSVKRRVSITDRVLRNKNCELQMKEIEETAKSRKNELAELLDEHAQIVQEVVTMVKSSSERSLAGKENSMEPMTDAACDGMPDE